MKGFLLAALLAFPLGCVGQPAQQPARRLADFPDPPAQSCAPLEPAAIAQLDIAIVIDQSISSADMTGFDINGNGRVGRARLTRGRPPTVVYSDPQDSLLAMEVVAARSLFRRAAGTLARFAVVSFAGGFLEVNQSPPSTPSPRSVIEALPSDDITHLEAALQRVLDRGSDGHTDFAAGMRSAIEALQSERDASRRPVVLFMSDSTFPSVRDATGAVRWHDPSMRDAASEAVAFGVVFHTFRVGPDESPPGVPDYLKHIAGATGGSYTATDLSRLHCALAAALAR
jgi:hypothetical protein